MDEALPDRATVEAQRAAVVTVLILGVVVLAALFGEVERRGYRQMRVEQLFDERPFGEQVIVHGVIERVEDRTEEYGTFMLEQDAASVKVYCSGNVSVSEGERVAVWGRFTTHDGVPEIATDCYMVRQPGGG